MLEHVFESTTAGVQIQAPQLDINTVAAGGGSCLFFRDGMYVVGPDSAGAHPGPVCYRKGGPLTITDANLFLGRIQAAHFPKIFGPTEDQPLDYAATAAAFQQLTAEINAFSAEHGHAAVTPAEVALGFIRVANESMCRPIRSLTQVQPLVCFILPLLFCLLKPLILKARGFDTRTHGLACFGGAGGQHACAIARSLGMGHIYIHKYAGILSAYGLAVADVVHERQVPCASVFGPDTVDNLRAQLLDLTTQCTQALGDQGFASSRVFGELKKSEWKKVIQRLGK